jgi:glutamate/aspartate transport system substrate-binding protein
MIRTIFLWHVQAAAVCGLLANGGAFAQATRSETLTRVARSGVINVGYIPTPGTFAFQNEAGETVGYSIDLCSRVIDGIRRALNRPDLRPVFRPVEAAQRIPLLKAGVIDMECGGNTNTQTRQKQVDFSYTFFTTGVRFLVLQPFSVAAASSLLRKKVAVTKGTTAEEIVLRLKNEQDIEPVIVNNDVEGVRLVENESVAAFAQDDVLLYGLIANAKLKDRLAVSGRFLTVEPYAFMLPKGDKALIDIVDKTLLSLMQSGEILTIYRKWFDTDRLRIPLNVYMKENFRFPNKYGVP